MKDEASTLCRILTHLFIYTDQGTEKPIHPDVTAFLMAKLCQLHTEYKTRPEQRTPPSPKHYGTSSNHPRSSPAQIANINTHETMSRELRSLTIYDYSNQGVKPAAGLSLPQARPSINLNIVSSLYTERGVCRNRPTSLSHGRE